MHNDGTEWDAVCKVVLKMLSVAIVSYSIATIDKQDSASVRAELGRRIYLAVLVGVEQWDSGYTYKPVVVLVWDSMAASISREKKRVLRLRDEIVVCNVMITRDTYKDYWAVCGEWLDMSATKVLVEPVVQQFNVSDIGQKGPRDYSI
ncbi:hypothetical protein Tco_0754185 [Tanacetum coccineum]